MKRILFFLVVVLTFQYIESICKDVYKDCIYKQHSDSEIEKATKYLQDKFALTHPEGKKCEKLHIIRDIKCMERGDIDAYIRAVKELSNPNNTYCQLVKNHPELVPSKYFNKIKS